MIGGGGGEAVKRQNGRLSHHLICCYVCASANLGA